MFLYNIDSRINELFDIIKEFPESTPAIEDLKLCIDTPYQRDQLVSVFRQAYFPLYTYLTSAAVPNVFFILVQTHS